MYKGTGCYRIRKRNIEMKKILLIISVIVVVFSITSCKTTEENYRSAYELAKEKKTETGDSLIDRKSVV